MCVSISPFTVHVASSSYTIILHDLCHGGCEEEKSHLNDKAIGRISTWGGKLDEEISIIYVLEEKKTFANFRDEQIFRFIMDSH
jgi:hypothetical protein